MQKYIHPFNEQHPCVYIVCDDQLASAIVNIQDALAIGSVHTKQLSASLSSDFHAIMNKKVKSIGAIRKAVYVWMKAVYNVETMFSRLLVEGHQQQHLCSQRLTVCVA